MSSKNIDPSILDKVFISVGEWTEEDDKVMREFFRKKKAMGSSSKKRFSTKEK